MSATGTRYEIEHITRFRYSEPVREAVLTLYLEPMRDEAQHVESFSLTTRPAAELSPFRDPFGNAACFFDIPGEHAELVIAARSRVVHRPPVLPSGPGPSWDELRALESTGMWHWLFPTPLTTPTPALADFLDEHGIERGETPLATIREVNAGLHAALPFTPGATGVDSPMDDAIERGGGVCQDFTHIMATILRPWGIPSRYVSGYLFPRAGACERRMASAGHAWLECFLPGMGWLPADPTNNTVAADRHIRVARGRDYRDVPPTRGTFRGVARQSLDVTVNIVALDSEDETARGADPAGAGA